VARPKRIQQSAKLVPEEHRKDAEPWQPDLFGKQWDVFNSRSRILLVSGSRLAAKTWICVHRICRHLFETPGARVAFVAKTIKLAKDSGTWNDLLTYAIPEWINADIGFNFTSIDARGTPGTKQDPQTRTVYFTVRNYYGGDSRAELFSIDNDDEVAAKLKGKRFSMVFFSELSLFKTRKVLIYSLPCLRMPHLEPKNNEPDIYHQWLADTNPDEDEGNKSWFYKLWYEERVQKDHPDPEFQADLGLIEMFMKDNPRINPRRAKELESLCADDRALYESHVLGIHSDTSVRADRHFSDLFSRNTHVIGGQPGEGDQIDVSPSTTTLFSGWDLGFVNHAIVFLDKRIIRQGAMAACWSVLDEVYSIGEQKSIGEITEEFLEKQRQLEKIYNRAFDWQHWSDDSALNVWRPSSASYDYMEVMAASHGKIRLEGVAKPMDSVQARVRLIRKLLRQKRLFVSSRCEKTIQMFEEIRKGEGKEYVMNNKHLRHVFDAMSYPIYMESVYELEEEMHRPDATEHSPNLVSV